VKTGIQILFFEKRHGFLSPLSWGQDCPCGNRGRNDKKPPAPSLNIHGNIDNPVVQVIIEIILTSKGPPCFQKRLDEENSLNVCHLFF
jgi:hypothetical protein